MKSNNGQRRRSFFMILGFLNNVVRRAPKAVHSIELNVQRNWFNGANVNETFSLML